MINKHSKNHNKITLSIFVVFILFIGLFLVFNSNNNSISSTKSNVELLNKYNGVVANRPVISFVPFGQDCANDFNCFIQSAQYCSNSSMELNYSLLENNLNYSFSQLLKVYPDNSGNCVWYQKSLGILVSPINSTTNNGNTNYSILQSAIMHQTLSNSNVGLYGRCTYSNSGELNSVLLSWKNSNFSSLYFGISNCSGSIFNSTNPNKVYSFSNISESCSLNTSLIPSIPLSTSTIVTTKGVADGTLFNYYCVSTCLVNPLTNNLYACNPSVPVAGSAQVYNSNSQFSCQEPVGGYYDLYIQNIGTNSSGFYCNQTIFVPPTE